MATSGAHAFCIFEQLGGGAKPRTNGATVLLGVSVSQLIDATAPTRHILGVTLCTHRVATSRPVKLVASGTARWLRRDTATEASTSARHLICALAAQAGRAAWAIAKVFTKVNRAALIHTNRFTLVISTPKRV